MQSLPIIFTIVAATSVAVVSCGPHSISKKRFEQCKNEAGLPNGKLTDFEDPKARCFYHCLFKKMGMITDGKILYEKALKIYQGDHPSMDDTAKNKLKECVDIANKKMGCEVTAVMVMCTEEQLPEIGHHH